MKILILHPGIYHADDVLVAAILSLIFDDLNIERRQPTPEELGNPQIIVADVGGDYNPELHNFDHHQDSNLDAACILAFSYYIQEIAKKFDCERFSDFYAIIKSKLLQPVSNVDTGRVKPTEDTSLNSIIRNFNGILSFDEAVEVAQKIFVSYAQNAVKAIRAKETWDKLPMVGNFKKTNSTEFIAGWKEFAAEQNIAGLISPNVRGGWQVVSRDTDYLVLPEAENATFRHNSGFMIVFRTKEEAIEYAKKVTADYIEKKFED